MKKLINDPRDVVPQLLEGLVAMTPGLALLEGEMVVVDTASAQARAEGRVALISGGGAGHEPAHAGYVGPGMLSAAVAGDVFTSPSTDAVLAAIRAVAGPGGVLLLVKNYTGDRLNFGLAAQIAATEGIPTTMVVVGDDVALAKSSDGHAGRRGLAGTVLVHKVAGAAAAAGLDLAGVKREAEAAARAVGTMGVALTPCIVPAAGTPGFTLEDGEIELGLGIHGEAGVRREALRPADALVAEMLGRLVADQGLEAGATVALLVNNLGGTPAMEMSIVARAALAWLEGKGIAVERAWCGTFLTALEMAGCSLSLMRLDGDRLARLDAPALAPAWPAAHLGPVQPVATLPAPAQAAPPSPVTAGGETLRGVLLAVADALQAAEPELTRMDQIVGDGDLGISMARGAEALRRDIATYPLADAAGTLLALSGTLRRALGGTSGPVYAVMLLAASKVLSETLDAWAAAFQEGCDAISEIGGAKEGDRTMLDALFPAARALATAGNARQALPAMIAEAAKGRDRSATLMPRRGRSSYLGDRALGHPDPGAAAVVVWLEAIDKALGQDTA